MYECYYAFVVNEFVSSPLPRKQKASLMGVNGQMLEIVMDKQVKYL